MLRAPCSTLSYKEEFHATQRASKSSRSLLVAGLVGEAGIRTASAEWLVKNGWDGKRRISYQQQKDLFYNYYAQPGPYDGGRGRHLSVPATGAAECRLDLGHLSAVHAARVFVQARAFVLHVQRRRRLDADECSLWHGRPAAATIGAPICTTRGSINIWPVSNDFFYPGLRF